MIKKISICAVIVSYEPSQSITRLINSIKPQVDEVIIIDNSSQSNQSKEILKSLENQQIKVIYNDKNYGIAKALNRGVIYAVSKEYKWVLTLDQDSEFYQDTYHLLLAGYEKFKNKEEVMLIAPKAVERISIQTESKQLPNTENIHWKKSMLNLTSGSLIKTEAFNHIGFFEEKLFIEQVDNDFCYRLCKKGYVIKIAENITFIHELGNASKKLFFTLRNHNPKRKYYLARNSVYIFKQHFFYAPYTTTRYLLGGTILGWLKILLFEQNKTSKIGSGIKGFVDGILNRY